MQTQDMMDFPYSSFTPIAGGKAMPKWFYLNERTQRQAEHLHEVWQREFNGKPVAKFRLIRATADHMHEHVPDYDNLWCARRALSRTCRTMLRHGFFVVAHQPNV
jgi:hypothetical protein